MTWHPLVLMQIRADDGGRPGNQRAWTLVWAVLVFLAWALVGFGWLRSR
ncbi:MAG TPA: hypothetical protein VFT47_10715 [Vicinamibacterales bacterium]|nr:hypothetical protein [Vicinamibacterales bacterium]